MRLSLIAVCMILSSALVCAPALGADITVHEMAERLYHAEPAHPADFSHRNLR